MFSAQCNAMQRTHLNEQSGSTHEICRDMPRITGSTFWDRPVFRGSRFFVFNFNLLHQLSFYNMFLQVVVVVLVVVVVVQILKKQFCYEKGLHAWAAYEHFYFIFTINTIQQSRPSSAAPLCLASLASPIPSLQEARNLWTKFCSFGPNCLCADSHQHQIPT